MFDPIFNFIEKLIEDFTWKRLSFVVGFLVIVISCLLGYEAYTDHFQLSRLDREIEFLSNSLRVATDGGFLAEKEEIQIGLNNVLESFNKRFVSEEYFSLLPTMPASIA